MHKESTQSKRAFTLVELLIALTIAAVLTAIALPTLKDSMRQNALSRSASVVKGAFINARNQAIRSGRPFGIVIERRRKRIGSGPLSDLDFFAANYSTRMYYVQSSIEYRGDSNNAVGYPVFINPNPMTGPKSRRGDRSRTAYFLPSRIRRRSLRVGQRQCRCWTASQCWNEVFFG